MNKEKTLIKIAILLLLTSILISSAYAFITNSTNYKLNPIVVSSGGTNMSSSNYNNIIATGIISGNTSSANYITHLGFFYAAITGDTTSPVVTLISPANSSTGDSSSTVTFTYNVTDSSNIANCSLLIDNSVDQTDTTITKNISQSFTKSLSNGDYNWSVNCYDSAANQGSSTLYYLTVSYTAPAEEPSAGDGGGGGGGGGGAITIQKDFSLSPSSIKAELVIGEATTKEVTITNTGSTALSGEIEVVGVKDYVLLPAYSFSLAKGETASIDVNIIAKKLGLFSGKLVFTSNGIEKEIPIIIEVETEMILFDVTIDIPTEYAEVEAGDLLPAQVTLLSMGLPKKVDVYLTYSLSDMEGNVIPMGYETLAVEKQLSFVKEFEIPKNLKTGDYVISVEARYADSVAVAGDIFKIIAKKYIEEPGAVKIWPWILLLIIIIILLTIIFNIRSYKMFKKRKNLEKRKGHTFKRKIKSHILHKKIRKLRKQKRS